MIVRNTGVSVEVPGFDIKTMYLQPKYLKKVGEIVSLVGDNIVNFELVEE